MKKLTFTLVALLTVLSATLAAGNESVSSQMRAVNINNKKIKVLYTSKSELPVIVRIKDQDGALLRTDRIKQSGGFMKPYNIEKLDSGTYYVSVTDQNGTSIEAVRID